MITLTSARDEARRQARRATIGFSLALAFSSWLLVALAIFVVGFAARPTDAASGIGEATAWAARNVGVPAMADAPWILPTLLAILGAIAASDWGLPSLRRARSARAQPAAGEEDSVQRLLSLVGGFLAATVLDYLLLVAGSVIVLATGFGDLVAVLMVGMWVVVFGMWSGTLAPRSADRIEQVGRDALARLDTRIAAMGETEPRPARSKSVARIAAWVAIPGAVAIALSVASTVVGTGTTATNLLGWSAIVAVVVGAINTLAAIGSAMLRTAAAGDRVGAGIAVGAISVSALGLVGVLALDLVGRGAFGIGVGSLVALLLAGVVALWSPPARWIARPGSRWAWTPAFAIDSLVRASLDRRRRRLLDQIDLAERLRREEGRRKLRHRFAAWILRH